MQAGQVVEHAGHGRALVQVDDGGQVFGVGVPLHVPAPLGQARGQGLHGLGPVAHGRDEVEAHAAHAQGMHAVQFGIGHRPIQYHHATVAAGRQGQRIEQHAVVGAVHAGLHQHQVAHAMRCGQRLDIGQRPVHGLVVAGLRRCGAVEHMHVGVPALGQGG